MTVKRANRKADRQSRIANIQMDNKPGRSRKSKAKGETTYILSSVFQDGWDEGTGNPLGGRSQRANSKHALTMRSALWTLRMLAFSLPFKGGGGQASQKGLGRVVIYSYSDLRRGRPEGGQSSALGGGGGGWKWEGHAISGIKRLRTGWTCDKNQGGGGGVNIYNKNFHKCDVKKRWTGISGNTLCPHHTSTK